MDSFIKINEKQDIAAIHVGTHARLLAGPGTGKTRVITKRVVHLIDNLKVPPEEIIVLTFTRAAAFELKARIKNLLGDDREMPRVNTLHSFALRQLLKNSAKIDTIPKPLRIAGDWDESNIILKDLKDYLEITKKEVTDKFNLLSADWETLTADRENWKRDFPDPKFLGLWQEHREVYGYTLRSELTYQLKKAIENVGDFSLESEFKYVLIDEYQDLNKCDIAIIHAISELGAEIYCAGDDDQSIYGFRHAFPEGIRKFTEDYIPSTSLTLEICVRCDKKILELSIFVANLDPKRIDKGTIEREDADEGDVKILRFQNELRESESIAKLCRIYIDKKGYNPDDILVILRSDYMSRYSSLLSNAMDQESVPNSINAEDSVTQIENFQLILAYLRLIESPQDSLSIREILTIEQNNVGIECHRKIYDIAKTNSISYSSAALLIAEEPTLASRLGSRISKEVKSINEVVVKITPQLKIEKEKLDKDSFIKGIKALVSIVVKEDNRDETVKLFSTFIEIGDISELGELISVASSPYEETEQEMEEGKVNIMTMHKAKGLTSKIVIIIAAEDELIPGGAIGALIDDERRLLYVSLTRAKNILLITYCNSRIGLQKWSGKNSGKIRRNLTRFLRDGPIKSEDGETYTDKLKST